jgi:hypothetical protein
LQLIECIESTQNEVKRKMIEAEACNVAPKSHARLARAEKVRATSQLTPPWSSITLYRALARFKRTLASMPAGLRGANLREAFRHL